MLTDNDIRSKLDSFDEENLKILAYGLEVKNISDQSCLSLTESILGKSRAEIFNGLKRLDELDEVERRFILRSLESEQSKREKEETESISGDGNLNSEAEIIPNSDSFLDSYGDTPAGNIQHLVASEETSILADPNSEAEIIPNLDDPYGDTSADNIQHSGTPEEKSSFNQFFRIGIAIIVIGSTIYLMFCFNLTLLELISWPGNIANVAGLYFAFSPGATFKEKFEHCWETNRLDIVITLFLIMVYLHPKRLDTFTIVAAPAGIVALSLGFYSKNLQRWHKEHFAKVYVFTLVVEFITILYFALFIVDGSLYFSNSKKPVISAKIELMEPSGYNTETDGSGKFIFYLSPIRKRPSFIRLHIETESGIYFNQEYDIKYSLIKLSIFIQRLILSGKIFFEESEESVHNAQIVLSEYPKFKPAPIDQDGNFSLYLPEKVRPSDPIKLHIIYNGRVKSCPFPFYLPSDSTKMRNIKIKVEKLKIIAGRWRCEKNNLSGKNDVFMWKIEQSCFNSENRNKITIIDLSPKPYKFAGYCFDGKDNFFYDNDKGVFSHDIQKKDGDSKADPLEIIGEISHTGDQLTVKFKWKDYSDGFSCIQKNF